MRGEGDLGRVGQPSRTSGCRSQRYSQFRAWCCLAGRLCFQGPPCKAATSVERARRWAPCVVAVRSAGIAGRSGACAGSGGALLISRAVPARQSSAASSSRLGVSKRLSLAASRARSTFSPAGLGTGPERLPCSLPPPQGPSLLGWAVSAVVSSALPNISSKRFRSAALLQEMGAGHCSIHLPAPASSAAPGLNRLPISSSPWRHRTPAGTQSGSPDVLLAWSSLRIRHPQDLLGTPIPRAATG